MRREDRYSGSQLAFVRVIAYEFDTSASIRPLEIGHPAGTYVRRRENQECK